MAERKYVVTIKESKGVCDSEMFKLMAENGDLQSTKVKDLIDCEISINGYALVNIETEDKNFDMTYISTKEYDLISSGSEILTNSLLTYYGKAEKFIIKEIKTKQGTTYKLQPALGNDENKEE